MEVQYRGPLPPPRMLADFEEAHPGTAAQILAMARDEQQHRHRMQRRALWCNVLIALACILGAVFVGYRGQQWVALVLGGSGLVSGVIGLIVRAWFTSHT